MLIAANCRFEPTLTDAADKANVGFNSLRKKHIVLFNLEPELPVSAFRNLGGSY